MMQSSPASRHFLSLRSKYSPPHPVLKHHQYVLPLVWETYLMYEHKINIASLCPCKKEKRNINFKIN
jgi:hypothetical protein